ncbi:hypothetical protein OPV22_032390 [Ensete ventricosum]|uniref:Uncharacterized protein n=1 Tax=Ensete ventricosum TaxID=4639 RepID=A0AAV8PZ56_ENSVE|nr:hypothetical protein OPV22_032390 [Ensete ventricosum]
MAGGGGGNSRELDHTPKWAAVVACDVIILISILPEMGLHFGEVKDQEALLLSLFFPCFNGFLTEMKVIWFELVELKKHQENLAILSAMGLRILMIAPVQWTMCQYTNTGPYLPVLLGIDTGPPPCQLWFMHKISFKDHFHLGWLSLIVDIVVVPLQDIVVVASLVKLSKYVLYDKVIWFKLVELKKHQESSILSVMGLRMCICEIVVYSVVVSSITAEVTQSVD